MEVQLLTIDLPHIGQEFYICDSPATANAKLAVWVADAWASSDPMPTAPAERVKKYFTAQKKKLYGESYTIRPYTVVTADDLKVKKEKPKPKPKNKYKPQMAAEEDLAE